MNSTKTRYIHAGIRIIAEYDGSDTFVKRYVHGPGLDEVLLEIDSSNDVTYLHHDRLGSIIATTDDTGAVIDTFAYSPWGESGSMSGTTFGFTGQRYDAETGLYFYKNRHYSPEIGRFLQPDPIGYGDGLNMYQYGYNNPNSFTDPLGLAADGSIMQSDNAAVDYGPLDGPALSPDAIPYHAKYLALVGYGADPKRPISYIIKGIQSAVRFADLLSTYLSITKGWEFGGGIFPAVGVGSLGYFEITIFTSFEKEHLTSRPERLFDGRTPIYLFHSHPTVTPPSASDVRGAIARNIPELVFTPDSEYYLIEPNPLRPLQYWQKLVGGKETADFENVPAVVYALTGYDLTAGELWGGYVDDHFGGGYYVTVIKESKR